MPDTRLFFYLLLSFTSCMIAADETTGQEPKTSIPAALAVPVAQEVTEVTPAYISGPKLKANLLKLPMSATVSDEEFLDSAMVRSVKEAAIYAPSTFLVESSTRNISQPYVRGIGGSVFNPAATTFIDGVPQFHLNSSNLNVLDAAQIDFTRGGMGTLYGRNTAGGGIHLTSNRPSLSSFGGEFQSTVGNYNLWDFRGSVTAPLIQDELGFRLAAGTSERDGYSQNSISGQDIDSRSAKFGKAQFLWTPDDHLEVRFIFAGESNQDGGNAWNDLQFLRLRPHETQSDFIGHTSRKLLMPTLQVTYHAEGFDFNSTTAYTSWEIDETSDLDDSPLPLLQQRNREQMRTWTQEFRFSNPADEPWTLSDELELSWQAGLLLFHSDYQQDLSNQFPALPIPLPRSSQSDLTQSGLGSYLQGTVQWKKRLSLTAGLRWDYERQEAETQISRILFISPATASNSTQSFQQMTPQVAISYQMMPELMSYVSFSTGYKAGGFNTIGPVTYEKEQSQNYEIGIKGRAWKNRLSYTLSAFHSDWQNLQMNQFITDSRLSYTQNAGDAATRGLESSLSLRLNARITFFGSVSWLDTEFKRPSKDYGLSAANNNLPYAPDYSFTLGALYNQPLTKNLSLYARVDIQTIGAFHYDALNTVGQDAYTLANARLGIRQNAWFAEAFMNNAFNTPYIPVAIVNQAIPGFRAESGAPLTFGVRLGIQF